MNNDVNGIICINKEQGMTSHDVCSRIRKILSTRKVGHSGTLDPMATGVMAVLVGKSTKLSRFIAQGGKEYIAGVRFGFESDSYDIWTPMESFETGDISGEQIEEALSKLTGSITQVPPVYSAIKVDGKPLYRYAREGIDVEIPKRQVDVYGIEILKLNLPESAVIKISCSGGTYVRSLVHDMGIMLGCHAVMESLVRTRSGCFTIENSVTLSELEELALESRLSKCIIPDDECLDFESVNVREESGRFLLNGNILLEKNLETGIRDINEGDEVKLYLNGRFIGLGRKTSEPGYPVIKPLRILYNSTND